MEPESNKEIDRHIDETVSIAVVSQQVVGLKELMLEKVAAQDVVLANIEKQTTKTNGHLADVTKEVDRLKVWRGFLTGAWAVVTLLVVPIVLFLLYQRLA